MAGHGEHNARDKLKRKNNYRDDKGEPLESVACSTQKQSSNKRNRKEVAIFGNYKNYYGYRVGQELVEDPRLKVMKTEWFAGKDCLDIGCNSGLITIAIAKKFGCRSILGVDIDGARINDANWTLRKVMNTTTPKMRFETFRSNGAALIKGSQNDQNESPKAAAVNKDLLEIVSFQKGNFVQNWCPNSNASYNAILCLSVTKWIHLNWGDDGIITLFSRVWRLLQPGGVFILEPQPWSSYCSNRRVSETAAANFKSIQMPPEDFQDVLLDKIGFRRVENITCGLSGTKAGFNRPILVFWK